MSLKTALINLAGSVGKCQENARSLKQCLELGLIEASKDAPGIDGASEIVKIWTNEHPGESYAPASVASGVATDVYDAFIIVCAPAGYHHTTMMMFPASYIGDNTTYNMDDYIIPFSDGVIKLQRRGIEFKATDSKVVFDFKHGEVSTFATYGQAGSSATSNTVMVPLYIFGVKF